MISDVNFISPFHFGNSLHFSYVLRIGDWGKSCDDNDGDISKENFMINSQNLGRRRRRGKERRALTEARFS